MANWMRALLAAPCISVEAAAIFEQGIEPRLDVFSLGSLHHAGAACPLVGLVEDMARSSTTATSNLFRGQMVGHSTSCGLHGRLAGAGPRSDYWGVYWAISGCFD